MVKAAMLKRLEVLEARVPARSQPIESLIGNDPEYIALVSRFVAMTGKTVGKYIRELGPNGDMPEEVADVISDILQLALDAEANAG